MIWVSTKVTRHKREGSAPAGSGDLQKFLNLSHAVKSRFMHGREAWYWYAKDVHEHLGFTVVDELTIGRGKGDRLGNFGDGSDGMVFEPRQEVNKDSSF